MDEQQVTARQAGQQWRDSELAKQTLREIIPRLKKSKTCRHGLTMVELAELTGIPRTTLYYIVWGRAGKKNDD